MLVDNGLSVVRTAALRGIEAIPVAISCKVERGIPGISLGPGMPYTVQEVISSIRVGLKASGFELPRDHVTLSCSPEGALRGHRSVWAAAAAQAMLEASGQAEPTEDIVVGQIGLDGSIHGPTRGIACIAELGREIDKGVRCGVPDYPVAGDVSDVRFFGSLGDLCRSENRKDFTTRAFRDSRFPDYARVHPEVARYISVSLVGGHGMLAHGPGWDVISDGDWIHDIYDVMRYVAPELEGDALSEAMRAHDAAGMAFDGPQIPIRAPHHSISSAGMLGGGRPVLPGEATLAHGGILVLNKMESFAPSLLESLRHVMADGEVRIVRAEGVYDFPASFLLLGRTDRDGYAGGPLSGSLDIHLDWRRRGIFAEAGPSIAEMRKGIAEARELLPQVEEAQGAHEARFRVARTLAALDGRTYITIGDLRTAEEMCALPTSRGGGLGDDGTFTRSRVNEPEPIEEESKLTYEVRSVALDFDAPSPSGQDLLER